MTASSEREPASHARLYMMGGWRPESTGFMFQEEWLQIDLGRPRMIAGLQTQAQFARMLWDARYADTYTFAYSMDNVTWHTYTDLSGQIVTFPGNRPWEQNNDLNVVTTNVIAVTAARYVRFLSTSSFLGMRVEVLVAGVCPPPPPYYMP